MTISDRALLMVNLTKCLRGELLLAEPEERKAMNQQIVAVAMGF